MTSSADKNGPPVVKPAIFIFLGVLAIGFFTSHATLSVDPPARYLEAKGLVDRGSLKIELIDGEPKPPGIFPGKGGELYSYFGIGQSLIFAGPYYIAKYAIGVQSDKLIRSMISITVFPLTLALTAVIFFLLMRRFGLAERDSYIAAILLVFSTGLWQVSKEGQEASHLALFFVLIAYGVIGYQKTGSIWSLTLSSLAVGGAFLIRQDTAPTVICYIVFAFYLISRANRQAKAAGVGLARRLWPYFCLVAATLPALMVHMAINYQKFGNPIAGHNNPFLAQANPFGISRLGDGLAGLLFSPGRSLFLYNPIFILAIPGAVVLWRRARGWAIFLLAVFAVNLLLFGSFRWFHGNCCWGPRYLCRIMPYLFIFVAFFMFRQGRANLMHRIVIVIVSAASVFVQIAAVSMHHVRELTELAMAYNVGWSDREWTMYEPESHFLTIRLANLTDGIDQMAHGQIAPWPTVPDDSLTNKEKLKTPVLNYLAFWPYHLTYYLPAIKPSVAVPLWGATFILIGGVLAGLLLLHAGMRRYGKVNQLTAVSISNE